MAMTRVGFDVEHPTAEVILLGGKTVWVKLFVIHP